MAAEFCLTWVNSLQGGLCNRTDPERQAIAGKILASRVTRPDNPRFSLGWRTQDADAAV